MGSARIGGQSFLLSRILVRLLPKVLVKKALNAKSSACFLPKKC